jgi:hypothetical protein
MNAGLHGNRFAGAIQLNDLPADKLECIKEDTQAGKVSA